MNWSVISVKLEIKEAGVDDKSVIRNMMELYDYDLSEFEDSDLNEHGLYDYKYLDNYWTEQDRHPYIIRVDSKLAGFVLVNKHGVTTLPTDYSIAEFFIMKKYRKQGISIRVAIDIFDRFRGDWEVKQLAQNVISHFFWQKVIGQYTMNNYEMFDNGIENWDGPIQRFNNVR